MVKRKKKQWRSVGRPISLRRKFDGELYRYVQCHSASALGSHALAKRWAKNQATDWLSKDYKHRIVKTKKYYKGKFVDTVYKVYVSVKKKQAELNGIRIKVLDKRHGKKGKYTSAWKFEVRKK